MNDYEIHLKLVRRFLVENTELSEQQVHALAAQELYRKLRETIQFTNAIEFAAWLERRKTAEAWLQIFAEIGIQAAFELEIASTPDKPSVLTQ